jgi:hypothetical protein
VGGEQRSQERGRTTNSSDTAGRTWTGAPSVRTQRTMRRKGGRLVPASTDSLDSVTFRSLATTMLSPPNFSVTCAQEGSSCQEIRLYKGALQWEPHSPTAAHTFH